MSEIDDYTPYVSVIIPVYNAADYLHQCLDSILQQTQVNIEIICVDNGSTDTSYTILLEYQSRDKRIIISSCNEMGAGAARNYGLSIARGEYLSFLDADDFFDREMLESGYQIAELQHADVVIYKYRLFNTKNQKISKAIYGIDEYHLQNFISFSYTDIPNGVFTITNTAAWNKLFRREFIMENNLQFMNLKHSNDVYFTLTSIMLAEKVSLVHREFIYYRIGLKTNIQSNVICSPFDSYLAILAVIKKMQNTTRWPYLDEVLADTSLNMCISSLYRFQILSQEKYSELFSLLKIDGFKKLHISDYKSGEIHNKWDYLQYLKVINSDNQVISLSLYPQNINEMPIFLKYKVFPMINRWVYYLKTEGVKGVYNRVWDMINMR